jgi:tetratricopeptide (TPR) repeat protein
LAEERPLYVAREEDIATLQQHWEAANAGQPRFVRVSADFGGGRRALVAEFLRRLRTTTDEPLLWRVAASDQEHGVGWLMRMYGALVAPIASDVIRRGKVEMVLNGQLPQQTRRVQNWYQQFVAGLKESKVDAQSGQVQLRIPQDNPLIGLIEIVGGISRKIPMILELQSPYVAHTVLVAQVLEALAHQLKDARLLVLIHDEPAGDIRTTTHPAPLLDLYERSAGTFHNLELRPWGEAETAAFLESKGLSGNAAGLAAIAGGRPGFIAELAEILNERGELNSSLEGVTLAGLTPMAVDEDELDPPKEQAAEGERRHATADDALRVAHLAALLGHVFPSSLIAEMGGFDRESIDDLLDAMGDLYDEVQFSEQMGTWLYRFKRGCWREGVLEMHNNPEGQEITRRVAVFMERFLAPRGQAFMTRAARLYAEGMAWQRAAAMRAIALTNDAPDAWGMAWEMMRYFNEVSWTETMRRTIMTTLLEHLSTSGNVQAAEQLHTEATAWATEHGDRELQGWLLLTGSKLDARRQDLFRARDRANDAIKLFEALENRGRVAEVYAHLAAVDLQDGQWANALANADKALEYGTREQDGKRIALPAILAQTELTRGVVARRENKHEEAIQHFRQANEVAGSTGLGPLALEAGIALGEALASNRQLEPARDVLGRVLQACRQLNATARERNTAQILAQVEGSLRNFGAALQLSQRVLQITQQMKFDQALPVDLYNVGFFNLTMNKGTEAVPFFEQALEKLKGQDAHPLLKDLHYHYGLASLQAGKPDTARGALRASLRPLQAAGETRKLVTALDQLAALEHRAGNAGNAKKLLEQAVTIADNAEMKDEKRELKRRLESLG